MKRLFYTLLFFLPCMLIACGGSDDTRMEIIIPR